MEGGLGRRVPAQGEKEIGGLRTLTDKEVPSCSLCIKTVRFMVPVIHL